MTDTSQHGDEHEGSKHGLGLRLRAARERLGLTQEELAGRVARKKNWLSDIERGRRGIDVHTLQRLADVMGQNIEFFTNPDYDTQRSAALPRPSTRQDWDLVYAGEPDRAAAHASLDEAFNRARRGLDQPPVEPSAD
jgi:transcriptional regulator with XRE-family HTH domain